MDEREPIKPTLDMPLDEALQELTGFEILAIQKKYGEKMENLGGIRNLMGAVWAFENRTVSTSWANIEGRTMRELGGYFASRDPDPESDQGKDSS